jgi:hypothetical protein
MTKNGVKAITELIMESKFGLVDTVEEMMAKGIKVSTT